MKVGVVGIGSLGHMAVKYAKAMGPVTPLVFGQKSVVGSIRVYHRGGRRGLGLRGGKP